jgi:hypothetical protein
MVENRLSLSSSSFGLGRQVFTALQRENAKGRMNGTEAYKGRLCSSRSSLKLCQSNEVQKCVGFLERILH